MVFDQPGLNLSKGKSLLGCYIYAYSDHDPLHVWDFLCLCSECLSFVPLHMGNDLVACQMVVEKKTRKGRVLWLPKY